MHPRAFVIFSAGVFGRRSVARRATARGIHTIYFRGNHSPRRCSGIPLCRNFVAEGGIGAVSKPPSLRGVPSMGGGSFENARYRSSLPPYAIALSGMTRRKVVERQNGVQPLCAICTGGIFLKYGKAKRCEKKQHKPRKKIFLFFLIYLLTNAHDSYIIVCREIINAGIREVLRSLHGMHR